MKASIVLASYNRNRSSFLPELMKSLEKQDYQLNQFEAIVVDNGSTQDIRDFLTIYKSRFAFNYIQLEGNPGPAKARNLGVKNAQGEVIFFTDDDCLAPPNWLSTFVKILDNHPEVAAVGGYQRAPQEILKAKRLAQYEWFVSTKIYGVGDKEYIGGFETPGVVTNNMVIRKSVFDAVGGFDEGFVVPAGEDADLKKRLVAAGYKLMYYPLGVEHHQKYELKRFVRQSFLRGVGSRHFQKKYQRDYSDRQLLLMVLINPLQSFIKFLKFSKRLDFAFFAAISELLNIWGQLRYNSFARNRQG